MTKIISQIPVLNVLLRSMGVFLNAYIVPLFIRKRFRHLRELKNAYKGKRCFVVATGPSLTIEDLELIKNEFCFSCNSVVKLLDKTSWKPNFYLMFDKDVYKRIKTDIERHEGELPNFYHPYDWDYKSGISRPYILKRDVWYSNKEKEFCRRYLNWKLSFSEDVSQIVNRGGNVVHVIMQFIYYMGFSEVYLLGCDCNFIGDKMHAEGLGYKMSSVSSGKQINDSIIEDYLLDKAMLERKNIKIYNATRGGKLELFPRVNLDDIIVT